MNMARSVSFFRSRLLFAGALVLLGWSVVSMIFDRPEPIEIGAMKWGAPEASMRPASTFSPGMESKAVTSEGRDNVFDFPKKRGRDPDRPKPGTSTSGATGKKDDLENGANGGSPPRSTMAKIISPRFYGILNRDRLYFAYADNEQGGIVEFRIGETIPGCDYTIVRATPDSVVLRKPNGGLVEMVLCAGKVISGKSW